MSKFKRSSGSISSTGSSSFFSWTKWLWRAVLLSAVAGATSPLTQQSIVSPLSMGSMCTDGDIQTDLPDLPAYIAQRGRLSMPQKFTQDMLKDPNKLGAFISTIYLRKNQLPYVHKAYAVHTASPGAKHPFQRSNCYSFAAKAFYAMTGYPTVSDNPLYETNVGFLYVKDQSGRPVRSLPEFDAFHGFEFHAEGVEGQDPHLRVYASPQSGGLHVSAVQGDQEVQKVGVLSGPTRQDMYDYYLVHQQGRVTSPQFSKAVGYMTHVQYDIPADFDSYLCRDVQSFGMLGRLVRDIRKADDPRLKRTLSWITRSFKKAESKEHLFMLWQAKWSLLHVKKGRNVKKDRATAYKKLTSYDRAIQKQDRFDYNREQSTSDEVFLRDTFA